MGLQETDGVTHVNVYSKGKTELGRLLSNFAKSPFYLPEFGHFESIEGFWYYLGAPDKAKAEKLRTLSGYAAKQYGRSLGAPDWLETEDFKNHVMDALQAKLDQSKLLQYLLSNVRPLPLKHYYVFKGHEVEPKEGKWMLDFWQQKWEELYG